MKNITSFHQAGVNLYINSQVGAASIGKVILVILNLICWGGYITVASFIPGESVGEVIVPLIIFFLFLVFVLGRYTVWNFWGKEYIRVSAKSISYVRSYGIIETTEKDIKINSLMVSYDKVRTFNEVEFGKLHFWDHDEIDKPFEVFQTTILMSVYNAEGIIMELDAMLNPLIEEQDHFEKYCLN